MSCAEQLRNLITLTGPIPLAYFMGAANVHYYATRDPLGAAGDFTTAPEVSQMFGELIGLWLADLWQRAGRPRAHYVELGPGRGTLASDALRAARKAGWEPQVHFVETSPALRGAQAERFPAASWHADVSTLPADAPLLIVANEFFDALPIRQLMRTAEGWRERMVAAHEDLFVPVPGPLALDDIVPEHLAGAPVGSIIESCPAAVAIVRQLADRLRAQGGALLAIDYGYEGPLVGDSFQAVRGHAFANPFEEPGERDLTAHVDFGTLGAAARAEGLSVLGPAGQGEWLKRLGIETRAAALWKAGGSDVDSALARLTAPEQMGRLFKAMAMTAPDWPRPEGFE